MVFFSPDPLNRPLRVDPTAVRVANQKTQSDGGNYRAPVALGEIAAYNLQGQPLPNLAAPAVADFARAWADPLHWRMAQALERRRRDERGEPGPAR